MLVHRPGPSSKTRPRRYSHILEDVNTNDKAQFTTVDSGNVGHCFTEGPALHKQIHKLFTLFAWRSQSQQQLSKTTDAGSLTTCKATASIPFISYKLLRYSNIYYSIAAILIFTRIICSCTKISRSRDTGPKHRLGRDARD